MAASVEKIDIDGLNVPLVFEEDNKLPLVSMQLVFKNSGYISSDVAGLARLSAKVLNQGTAKDGHKEFSKSLDERAISISISTGTETFVIEVTSLKDQFDYALSRLSDLLKDPNINEDSLNRVKSSTIGSLSRKENDYDYVASNLLKGELFRGTPLKNPANGDVKSVEAIKIDDIKKFLNKHVVYSNAIVVVGGDIDLASAKKDAKNLLSILDKGEKSELIHYSVSDKKSETIVKKETDQAYLYFGSPYYAKVDDLDNYKASVSTYILGAGGFGSRLMEEIRVKKGLAYSAYARVNINNSASYLNGHLQTKLESLDDAKKTVFSVFDEFVDKGVTQDELDQAKKFLLGAEPLRVETLSQRLSRTFLEFYKGKELGSSKKDLEKISKLELNDLNDYIKNHDEILNLSVAIVTK